MVCSVQILNQHTNFDHMVIMDVLISNWKDVKSVPQSFVLPPNIRPGKNTLPICTKVPIIDLQKSCNVNRAEIIQQILKASREFGLFQVINHGVSTTLMDDAMNVSKAFFSMPSEYKASFYSNDSTSNCRLYTSTLNYDKEEFHFWRDNLTHRSHPSLPDHILFWPDKPTNYRKTMSSYSTEVRKLLLNILDMISEGLGLDLGYFEGGLSQNQLMSINHHIPCPDPSLTLGMPEHGDPNLISMLHEGDVPGLQILKDGQWLAVNPLLNALVVIPGLQLRVISNENFKTVIHRVVTNSETTRTTISVFVIPSIDFIIEPARSLISGNDNPIYRAYTYKEFFNTYIQNKCDVEAAMKCFRAFNDK